MLGFKHFQEKAHKAENNQNKQKIDEKMEAEERALSKWLNKSESQLKFFFGRPDKIEFKENSRNRFYIYIKEKLIGVNRWQNY